MIDITLERVMQEDRGRCLAALVARTGDFQRAEDAHGLGNAIRIENIVAGPESRFVQCR